MTARDCDPQRDRHRDRKEERRVTGDGLSLRRYVEKRSEIARNEQSNPASRDGKSDQVPVHNLCAIRRSVARPLLYDIAPKTIAATPRRILGSATDMPFQSLRGEER
jgi:hypothetical protein